MGQLELKTMDLPVAPDSLLKLIRCQCKGNCDTRRCSCKRIELECSSACGECKGLCQNSNLDGSTDDPIEYELLSRIKSLHLNDVILRNGDHIAFPMPHSVF